MVWITDWKNTAIIAGASFFIGATSAWWITSDYKHAKYQHDLAQMQKSAMEALVKAQESAIQIERENNRLAQELQVQNERHKQELDRLESELRGYVTELGGLYDRYATCSSASVPTNTGTTPQPAATPAGCKLSKSATQLLLSESKRADQAAAYAQTCYNWIQQLRTKQ